ncbi:MAG: hypothetical protein GXO79_13520 [Chlorobi bacterium]|nr:hypothetical protein [Chlorobiota bacterium]
MLILKVILLSIALLAIAFAGFATQILLKKGGKFPNTSIGGNPNMRKLGITCVKCEEQAKCILANRELAKREQ